MRIDRITDEQLERMAWGNSAVYGYKMAESLAEAATLVNESLMALGRGQPLTQRQYSLVAWLLSPVGEGERQGNELPFKKGAGRKPGTTVRGEQQALAVQMLRNRGIKKDDAIAKVAGAPERETSVRGQYERAVNSEGLNNFKARAKALENTAQQIKALAEKGRNVATRK